MINNFPELIGSRATRELQQRKTPGSRGVFRCCIQCARTNRRRGRRGMTLIEVLMSFAILITGLVSIFAMLNAGFANHKRAIHETEAAIAAESVLDNMRAEFAAGGLPRTDLKGSYNEYSDNPDYSYNRVVVPLVPQRTGINQGAANKEYFVRVTVRWMQQGEDKTVVCDTIMLRNADKPRR